MRPGALVVNTCRGGLVDEAAVADALRAGRLAGAALDAFETEPLPADSLLRSLPNVLLSPARCLVFQGQASPRSRRGRPSRW